MPRPGITDNPLRDRSINDQSSVLTLASSIEGRVDKFTPWDASGWVWLPSKPDCTVEVEATVNGRVIARAKANLPRLDLVFSGKCKGWHGFRLLFEQPLDANVTPIVRTVSPIAADLTTMAEDPLESTVPVGFGRCDKLVALLNDHMQFTTAGYEYEEFDAGILRNAKTLSEPPLPLLLAFYLPQFHPIPENDAVWGRGFTEWRQLPRSIPRFPGHYQPRIPRDLGFYDLTSNSALRAQTELAKAAGIGGFAFHYYRFGPRRVLETPLEQLLASDIDMPFLLNWANESWTRRWSFAPNDIILKQSYAKEHDEVLLEDLCRHFNDRRYIRVGGRPLFVIYDPKDIPNAAETIERWRSTLSCRYGVKPLMFMAQTWDQRDPAVYGLDGALEFPPHKFMDRLPYRSASNAYSDSCSCKVFNYDEFVKASLEEPQPEFPLIKTIVPSWDNDARYPNSGYLTDGLSPKKYEAWLEALILRSMERPVLDVPIVAINAWNEWAEGAYLEPDVYYGAAFLNATARAYVSALRTRLRNAP